VYDAHGSVSLLLDQANVVKKSYGYAGYGGSISSVTKNAAGFTDPNKYQYTGKRWDAATGSYDIGLRRFTPGSSRWLQQDLYYDALANLGLSADPMLANRYMFAGANPANFIELDGHRFESEQGRVLSRKQQAAAYAEAAVVATVTMLQVNCLDNYSPGVYATRKCQTLKSASVAAIKVLYPAGSVDINWSALISAGAACATGALIGAELFIVPTLATPWVMAGGCVGGVALDHYSDPNSLEGIGSVAGGGKAKAGPKKKAGSTASSNRRKRPHGRSTMPKRPGREGTGSRKR
jgi:RHS repeat-associated protein